MLGMSIEAARFFNDRSRRTLERGHRCKENRYGDETRRLSGSFWHASSRFGARVYSDKEERSFRAKITDTDKTITTMIHDEGARRESFSLSLFFPSFSFRWIDTVPTIGLRRNETDSSKLTIAIDPRSFVQKRRICGGTIGRPRCERKTRVSLVRVQLLRFF